MSESSENGINTTGDIPSRLVNRRTFLKSGLATLALIVANSRSIPLPRVLGKNTEYLPSQEKLNDAKVAIIDIFGSRWVRDGFVRELLPPSFSSEAEFEKMKIADPNSNDNLINANIEPSNDDQIKLILLKILENTYSNHGLSVKNTFLQTGEILNEAADPDFKLYSLNGAMNIDPELKYDDLGNPSLEYEISTDQIIKMIEQSGADIINMSFQPGKNKIKFGMFTRRQVSDVPLTGTTIIIDGVTHYRDADGNEITEDSYNSLKKQENATEIVALDPEDRHIYYTDGYSQENPDAEKNLRQLHRIAARFPNKIFVAAGGNHYFSESEDLTSPDFRIIRKKLEEEGVWQNNVILAGYEGYAQGNTAVSPLGADYYVPYEIFRDRDIGTATSYAAPIITRLIIELKRRGKFNDTITLRTLLDSIAIRENYWVTGNEQQELNFLPAKPMRAAVKK